MADGRFLSLGWAKYLDAVHLNDEVWIFFTGPRFENGVYAKGLVAAIDADVGTVTLRVRHHSTIAPLTDSATSAALRTAVSTRYRQVFLWPTDRAIQEECHVAECGARQCLQCDVWSGLPTIDAAHYRPPGALRGEKVVPAYWTIPNRCYLYYGARAPAPWNRRVTDMFAAFKVGESRYAFPLAAGIASALDARGLTGFDAIVPIPLSPEKAASGELDRTAALSAELSRLTGVRTRPHLGLAGPISKRRMQAQGYTPTQFKARYRQLLQVHPAIARYDRILLLDDAITRGSTLAVTAAAIRAAAPEIDIVLASAAQMIVMEVVANQNGPAW
jgi:predicted amidophosphoribosyltransferase